MSPLSGGVSGKGAGDSRKVTAEEELNHNILEAAEDIDLNDDEVEAEKTKSTSQNGSSGDQFKHHISPLEQVNDRISITVNGNLFKVNVFIWRCDLD